MGYGLVYKPIHKDYSSKCPCYRVSLQQYSKYTHIEAMRWFGGLGHDYCRSLTDIRIFRNKTVMTLIYRDDILVEHISPFLVAMGPIPFSGTIMWLLTVFTFSADTQKPKHCFVVNC